MPKSGKPGGKKPPVVDGLAKTIMDNTNALLRYAKHNESEQVRLLSSPQRIEAFVREKQWGDSLSKSLIYRLTKGDRAAGTGADVLDLLARCFDLEAWHMLIPNLNPAHPPLLLTDPEEIVLIKHARHLARKTTGSMEDGDAGRGMDRDRDPTSAEKRSDRASAARRGRGKSAGD